MKHKMLRSATTCATILLCSCVTVPVAPPKEPPQLKIHVYNSIPGVFDFLDQTSGAVGYVGEIQSNKMVCLAIPQAQELADFAGVKNGAEPIKIQELADKLQAESGATKLGERIRRENALTTKPCPTKLNINTQSRPMGVADCQTECRIWWKKDVSKYRDQERDACLKQCK